MRLTIIPSDSAVYRGDVSYLNLDLSECNIPAHVTALQWDGIAQKGWIEFTGATPNEEITILPAWALCAQTIWETTDIEFKNPPPLTEEQLVIRAKYRAEQALQESDWAVLPDVSLVNKAEWETYRATLRSIVINPTPEPVWPTKPAIIWS
jgi:hypothetical protein